MRIVNHGWGIEPSVSSLQNCIVLNSAIKYAWKEYHACIVDYEPHTLTITADNDGDYTLSTQQSCLKVCTYKLRDILPKGKLKCKLDGNVLTITF